MKKPLRLWIYLRSSFWFLPSLIVTGSVVLAVKMVEADANIADDTLARWPRLFGAGADGAREMLSTIASSMMTVVGVTFSMTLVTLALASSQYTSRILGSFIRSRVTQTVLGIFAGIFTYCLIVLRTIRGGDEMFVPSVAVLVGVVLALAGVGVLILFIHHIATSIQASNIICSVADETMIAIDRVFPAKLSEAPDEDDEIQPLHVLIERNITWHIVPAAKSGYIQGVEYDALLGLARERNIIVQMNQGIGEFVVKDTALASLALEGTLDKETVRALRSFYSIGSRRTIEQDPAFGIRQIVDVALTALSPGVNDTTTAVTCVDYLAAILSDLAPRRFPSRRHYAEGKLRMITIGSTFATLLAASFDEIRGSAKGNAAIMVRMLVALQTIITLTTTAHRRKALREQAQRIAELAHRSVESAYDRALIDTQFASVSAALEEPAVSAEDKSE